MTQPSGAIGADAVSTSCPWIFIAPCKESRPEFVVPLRGGPGAARKIAGPVIALCREFSGYFPILEGVGPWPQPFEAKPRSLKALFAGQTTLRQFGEGGPLPQQPQRIESALLDRARRPWQLG